MLEFAFEPSGGVTDMVANIEEIVAAASDVFTFAGLAATEYVKKCAMAGGAIAPRLPGSPPAGIRRRDGALHQYRCGAALASWHRIARPRAMEALGIGMGA